MKTNENYPDIEFVGTDAQALVSEMIEGYEAEMGRVLYPADPMRLLILWFANIIIQERVLINETAKQNVPRYASGENLDSLAELFRDVARKPATAATTKLRYTLSQEQGKEQVIPKGSRVEVDGNVVFETTQEVSIPKGVISGTVEAKCTVPGEAGNGFKAGKAVVLIETPPFVQNAEIAQDSAGGTEIESDESLYLKMRESLETFSTAGTEGGYRYHAMAASAAIADVAVDTKEAGVVNVCVMLKDGEMPDDGLLEIVQKALTSDKVRPLTDVVEVKAPEAVSFKVELTYFLEDAAASSEDVMRSDVGKAAQQYVTWQTQKMGRDINPSYLTALVMQTGVKRVDVVHPAYKVVQKQQVARIEKVNDVDSVTCTKGGGQ